MIAVKSFSSPTESVGDLDAQAASTLILSATDIALVVDRSGIVRDLSFQSDELVSELDGVEHWPGQAWSDIVTSESRAKLDSLRRDASNGNGGSWRHVNHPSPQGGSVPVLYSAVQLGDDEHLVVLGRDLRQIAALQQRLVEAQQAMERDYSRLRNLEMRYRLLFEMSSEAVCVVDAATAKIVEANPAACQLFGETMSFVLGRPMEEFFGETSRGAVSALFAGVRSAGQPDQVRAALAFGERKIQVAASMFRQENQAFFLVRLTATAPADTAGAADRRARLLSLIEQTPDGVVLTDAEGRIVIANAAFLDLAQLASEAQAKGEPLRRWLGRPGSDVDVMIANLRQRGSLRLFATTLNGTYGAASEVEIAGARLQEGGEVFYSFTIRDVGRRLREDGLGGKQLPRSVTQLTELVGRVALKDLVRETADVIEHLCIEAALEMTKDNRALAAELLGLSRQTFYVKLRRYGLQHLVADADEDA